MATKFNIARTQRSLPGRASAVRANLDVDTGEQMIARAVGGLGQTLSGIGIRIEAKRKQMQDTRSAIEAEALLKKAVLENLDYRETEPDTSKWTPDLKRRLQEASGQLSGLNMSDEARERMTATFWANYDLELEKSNIAATKQEVKDTKTAVTLNLIEAIESGDDIKVAEATKRFNETMSGLVTEAEAKEMFRAASATGLANKKARINDSIFAEASKLPLQEALTFINTYPGITSEMRNDIIARRKRQEEIATATTDPKVRWDMITKVSKDADSISYEDIEDKVGKGLSWQDAEDVKKLKDSKDDPLKTPRAQLYFNRLQALYPERDTDNDEAYQWDIANEKLMDFFKQNPKATAKQAQEFYDELADEKKKDILERLWDWNVRWRPYEIYKRTTKPKSKNIEIGKKAKSPFPEYPDAYEENGQWYVIRSGKRYRVEK